MIKSLIFLDFHHTRHLNGQRLPVMMLLLMPSPRPPADRENTGDAGPVAHSGGYRKTSQATALAEMFNLFCV